MQSYSDIAEERCRAATGGQTAIAAILFKTVVSTTANITLFCYSPLNSVNRPVCTVSTVLTVLDFPVLFCQCFDFLSSW